jgi:RNA polymerase sigma-70 factor (ECF subfamily)
VDEVVQDAFLYLMVSLPELDSEIGVLRFLKWKTRLLALDVIRASGRAYINSIDDVQEPASADPEISSALEQQDDAAVVKLALSKLNPRHREVLIASMYEEKSTEQIAAQVGLSENATRQLIFRARAAFKKALIGDVDTTGMSAAAILSVAARKAASEGKKVGAAALTLIALVVMSLTVFPGLNRATTDQMAEAPVNPGASESSNQDTDTGAVAGSDSAGSAGSSEMSSSAEGSPDDAGSGATESSESVAASPAKPKTPKDPTEGVLSGPALGSIMNADVKSTVFVLDQNYTAVGDNGLSARFTFNPTTENVFSGVVVEVTLGDMVFDVKLVKPFLMQGKNDTGEQVYIYAGQAPFLFDEDGQKWTETEAKNAVFKVEVIMESNGVDVKEVILALYKANQ